MRKSLPGLICTIQKKKKKNLSSQLKRSDFITVWTSGNFNSRERMADISLLSPCIFLQKIEYWKFKDLVSLFLAEPIHIALVFFLFNLRPEISLNLIKTVMFSMKI